VTDDDSDGGEQSPGHMRARGTRKLSDVHEVPDAEAAAAAEDSATFMEEMKAASAEDAEAPVQVCYGIFDCAIGISVRAVQVGAVIGHPDSQRR